MAAFFILSAFQPPPAPPKNRRGVVEWAQIFIPIRLVNYPMLFILAKAENDGVFITPAWRPGQLQQFSKVYFTSLIGITSLLSLRLWHIGEIFHVPLNLWFYWMPPFFCENIYAVNGARALINLLIINALLKLRMPIITPFMPHFGRLGAGCLVPK